jgi:ABC-2 type transport system permease protein
MMSGFFGMVRRMVRSITTRGRVFAMLAVGGIGVAIGVFLDRADGVGAEARVAYLSAFGLTVFVPLVVLVVATATLGNLVEEKTLVYFWLRPVGRWQIALAGFVASMLVLLPLVLVPMGVLGAIVGDSNDLTGLLVASAVGVLGYGSIFTMLGLITQRALVWGLVYVLVWEGFVAGLSRTAGWLALRTHTTSILARISETPDLIDRPTEQSTVFIITAGIVAVAFMLTTLRLARMNVD